MPLDELHLRLERTRLFVRPALAAPYDQEFPVDLDGSSSDLELLRWLRECLCSANPQHPSDGKWFEFLGRRLAARWHQDATRYLANEREEPVRVFFETALGSDEESDALRSAPWELLRFRTGRGNESVLGTTPKLTFTRLVAKDATQATPGPVLDSSQDKLRVLLVDAETFRGGDLGGNAVHQRISQQINGEVERWEGKHLRTCWERVTAQDKDSYYVKSRFDVIHILGHGKVVNNQVEIEIDQEGTMSATQLAEALAGRCRAVVLQSCTTAGAAPALLSQGPEAVVAMLYSVDRDCSTKFITVLYKELAAGQAIDVAVQAGRRALDPYGRAPSVGAPVLFARTSRPIAFKRSNLDAPAAATVGAQRDVSPPAQPERSLVDAVVETPVPPPGGRTGPKSMMLESQRTQPRAGVSTRLLDVFARREEA